MTSFPREEPAVSVSSSACAVNEKEPVKNIKVNNANPFLNKYFLYYFLGFF